MTEKNIMTPENILPEDFDGVFRFSNPSDEDFIGVWGGQEYLFPAGKTVPMRMLNNSPLEIQYIRKKFAKDLAEREFYKSTEYKGLADQEGKPGNRTFSGIHQAATYTLGDLEPYIQQCLKPLEEARLTSQPAVVTPIEEKLSRNDDGEFNTEAIDGKTSLKAKALAK